jgi:hypothetical protein
LADKLGHQESSKPPTPLERRGDISVSNGALVNLGDISKPATVLIENISDVVGTVFEPYQIKRVAKAEVEAEKIKRLHRLG